jgi:hypothetical protein
MQYDLKVLRRLELAYPEFHEAHRLHEESPAHRWTFEASVLADAPREELAKSMLAAPGVLEIYEKIFFDVRPYLANRMYIINNVLQPAIRRGMHVMDSDFTWKVLAYMGGWEMVSTMWEIDGMSATAEDFFRRTHRQRVIRDSWLAAHSSRINIETVNDVVIQAFEIQRIEQQEGLSAARDAADASMKQLMQNIQINVQSPHIELPADEPRASEMMDVPTMVESE